VGEYGSGSAPNDWIECPGENSGAGAWAGESTLGIISAGDAAGIRTHAESVSCSALLESTTCRPSNKPQFALTGLRELAIGLSKLSTPLGRDSEEIKEGGSKRISNQSLAGWSFKKRIFFIKYNIPRY
jgi:hypothetical protein